MKPVHQRVQKHQRWCWIASHIPMVPPAWFFSIFSPSSIRLCRPILSRAVIYGGLAPAWPRVFDVIALGEGKSHGEAAVKVKVKLRLPSTP
jgi:hypothetical protein